MKKAKTPPKYEMTESEFRNSMTFTEECRDWPGIISFKNCHLLERIGTAGKGDKYARIDYWIQKETLYFFSKKGNLVWKCRLRFKKVIKMTESKFRDSIVYFVELAKDNPNILCFNDCKFIKSIGEIKAYSRYHLVEINFEKESLTCFTVMGKPVKKIPFQITKES